MGHRRHEERRAPAKNIGVDVVNGFTGSSIWHLLYSFPPVSPEMIEEGFANFANRWNPILDEFDKCGVKFALEVHPTEIAFDIAHRRARAEGHRQPQGVRVQLRSQPPGLADGRPVNFIRKFADRIFHVHMKDAYLSLDGEAASSAHLNFGTRGAAGTSAAWAAAASISRRSSAPSTTSATTARSPSNGKTPAMDREHGAARAAGL